ncbi:MAG: tetratricopeptide repeat protein [Deltaproteobacteria bacterium]|nr:tetratricopeptide repeat protein [Deltaproteobacteria bacterium]
MKLKQRQLLVGALVGMFLSIGATLGATPKKETRIEEEINTLALVSVLISDKHFDRAVHMLEQIDLKKSGVDKAHYYLLLGLAHLSLSNVEPAYAALKASVKNGQSDPMVYVFLAQAAFKLAKYKETVEFVDASKGAGNAIAATHMLKANACWKLNDYHGAWKALQNGIARFPDNAEMKRSSVLVLVEAGLFRQAIGEGRSFLTAHDVKPEDYTVIAEAFMNGGAPEEAILFLEAARLTFPNAPELTVQLARAYMKAGNELISARLFEHAAMENETFCADAAELYRRNGQHYNALRMNERIVAQQQKIRQRMGILLEMSRFEEAAGLAPRLFRLGLLDEAAVRYGLAYAQFKNGELSEAEQTLSNISDEVYFNKAMELRLAIERCRADGWQCD